MKCTARAASRAMGVLLIMGALAALNVTSIDAGGKPERLPYDVPSQQTFGAGEVCPFPVLFTVVENKVTVKVFPADENGDVREFLNGRFTLRVTNQTTGESRVFNSSGPSTLTFHPDGTVDQVQHGSAVFQFYPGEPFGPNLYLLNERLAVHFSPEFVVLSATHSGRMTSICDLLAG